MLRTKLFYARGEMNLVQAQPSWFNRADLRQQKELDVAMTLSKLVHHYGVNYNNQNNKPMF